MNGVNFHDSVDYDGYPEWWVWWLEHGLDGIAGGLIAGAVAGWVLYRTIRHERELREEQDLAQAKSALQNECLQFLGLIMELDVQSIEENRWRTLSWVAAVYKAALLLEMHARLAGPVLAAELSTLWAQVDLTGSVDDVEEAIGFPTTTRWTSTPRRCATR